MIDSDSLNSVLPLGLRDGRNAIFPALPSLSLLEGENKGIIRGAVAASPPEYPGSFSPGTILLLGLEEATQKPGACDTK